MQEGPVQNETQKPLALRKRLAFRFAALLVGLLLAVVGVFVAWSSAEQSEASEQKVLDEARLLTTEMQAAWDYVDAIQVYINYDRDGVFNFKDVYCSVAGKAIARRFSNSSDVTVRYTRLDPRTPTDAPDEFESAALAAFAQGDQQEYYGTAEYQGEQVFRYLTALKLDYGCLDCHGDPAGQTDETGYPKEGMRLGDIAGAVSLVIPMEPFIEEAAARTTSHVVLFVVLAVVIVAAVSTALYIWVTRPLSRLADAARAVGSGNFDYQMGQINCTGEIAALAVDFWDMEKRLEASYADLEDQVRARTTELAAANEQLEAENEYKSIFLSTMTHELRTPLASIIAFVDVWLKAGGHDPADVVSMQDIRSSSTALLDTINNSLDAASIEAKRFAVAPVPTDLYDVLNAVESVIAPLATERSVAFCTSIPDDLPIVSIDQNVLFKVLVNLLGNAVKFTDEPGQINLTARVNRSKRTIEFEVADTGIGIPQQDLDLIFERFRQADESISRRYGGSGLGLSLVREMCELMGGGVRVISVEGEGSTFTVTLPLIVLEGE